MIFTNPTILVNSFSFQLSFLASLGLVFGVPIIEKYLQWVTVKFGLREVIATTISAQIAVLPLILFKTGNLSLVALPVNVLVLPLIPQIMSFGFLAGTIGFASRALSLPFGYISYLMISYVLKIVAIGVSVPGAAVTINYFPWWVMLAAYVSYGIIIWRWRKFGKNSESGQLLGY
jgi:competence protein ComEC